MKKLFSPIRIGGMEAKNRIVMPAMHLNYTMGGEVSDQLIEFYEERAAGGVGTIVIGGCSMDESGAGPLMIGLNDDRFLPGLQRFTDRMHAFDVRIVAQLYQAGRYAFSFLTGTQSISPSPIASKLTGEEPKEMTVEDIRDTVCAFADASARAKAAGFDGVEILASAGYLICQFLSPLTNKRTDEYGGPIENRMRFAQEVIAAVREAVGPDFTIFMRVAGNDFMPGSNTNEDIQGFCRAYEEAGVDLISVTGGWHETKVPQLTYSVPPGAYSYLASAIKSQVTVPVISANRIVDPRQAEELLLLGKADLVAMGRALIADPEMPNKAREGRFDEIIHCIACNQGCFDAVFQGKPVGCMVNPRVGQEKIYSAGPAEVPKKVMVVGGGPAGLAAAQAAAMRGHNVTLYEAEDLLGGQFFWGTLFCEKNLFYSLIEDLAVQLDVLGVDVVLNRSVDVETVREESPEAVILAAGAVPVEIDIPGVDLPHVYGAFDVIKGGVEIGRKVAIIGGGAVACDVALEIAMEDAIDPETAYFLMINRAETMEKISELVRTTDREITMLEMLGKMGNGIGKTTRWTVLQDLARRGVTMSTNTKAVEITGDAVIVDTGQGTERIEADTVIVAVGTRPRTDLKESLEDAGVEVVCVGDVNEPRNALEAIKEGFEAGFNL